MSTLQEIYEWVNLNGYPLEMRVANTLRGFDPLHVAQSYFQPDGSTGKMREIDVMATWAYVGSDVSDDAVPHVFTNLTVECKDIPHAWVLFQDAGSEYGEIPRTVLALNAIPCRLPEFDGVETLHMQVFPVDNEGDVPAFLQGTYNPCYALKQKSIGQKKAENSDPAYNAVRKIGEAAIVSTQEAKAGYHRSIPVIVTTADLYVCSLRPSGDIEIKELSRSSILLQSSLYDEPVEVHILRESELPRFAQEVRELAQRLAEQPEYRDVD